MNMNKLAKMFGVNPDNDLQNDYNVLAESYDVTKQANTIMAKQIIELENELERIKKDVWAYVDEEKASREEELKHRWIAEGRQAAYFDMGIWNLEAHERGNVLVMNKEGDIFELITELEDVEGDQNSPEMLDEYLGNEITIDDLAEV